MARPIKFKIRKAAPDKWIMNIPASVSETGKRQQLTFPTQQRAQKEQRRRLDQLRSYGRTNATISASLAEQAAEAHAILTPYNVTIVEAARHFVAQQERIRATKTVLGCLAWLLWKKRQKSRKYQIEIKSAARRLPPSFLALPATEVTPPDIENAIATAAPKAPYLARQIRKNLRTAFNLARKKGWLPRDHANPVKDVEPAQLPPLDVPIVTIDQAQRLFDACSDQRGNELLPQDLQVDCSDAVPAVALMLFAGIRPSGELGRLQWDDINLDGKNIRIPAGKSKTRTVRNVPISDNLALWLEPHRGSTGPVVPPNWHRKNKALRRIAGITGQDTLRHSFGSYHYSAYADSSSLQSAMGHKWFTTFQTHYSNAVPKETALNFWKIVPKSAKPPRLIKLA